MTRHNDTYLYLSISMLILLSLNPGCKSQKIPGSWTESEIRIDGKIDDWQNIPVMFYEEEGAAVSFCNDSSWLNIQFRTTDPKWARSIKVSGITLYFDTNGKQNKDFFIKYQGGPPMNELMNKLPARMKEKMPHIGSDPITQFSCYIKNRIIEKPIHTDGSEGPAAAYDTSYGFYCYEFRLPLEESTIRYYGLGIEPGKPISIGVEWGAMGDMKNSRPDMNERSIGMDGGRGGGRMGGGPRGGGRKSNRGEMPSKQEVWLQCRLAASIDSSLIE